MEYADTFVLLAGLFGFIMACGVGANDVANAMGTSVGSKALTIRQAILIAIVFEATGALLAGGAVTDTIRGRIVAPSAYTDMPELFIIGMLASLLAAGLWLVLASIKGWPVSTTHSIVGAIIGFGVVSIGPASLNWSVLIGIIMSWFVTPFFSGLFAFLLFRSVQRFVLLKENPFESAKKSVPAYVFIVAFIITMVTMVKGLKHIGLHFSFGQSLLLSLLISMLFVFAAVAIVRTRAFGTPHNMREQQEGAEKVFGFLMIFTACSMAFAHGSNDVANAIGPLAAVVTVAKSSGDMALNMGVPIWVLLVGALGIVTGLATYGYRMIAVIGHHITELTPSRGFSAELATAMTVVFATGTGLPISTTQTLVGAIMGVGFARGISAINLRVIRNIVLSWFITLPAGSALAIGFYFILKAIYC